MSSDSRLVNQNWWFTTLMVNPHTYCPPLTKDIKCDVLIVGGGFSGVSAAAEFLKKGLSVVLIEKNIVGGSSSGRSAGMLTPDSELELHQLVRRYGVKAAGEIWEAPCRGIARVVETIQRYDIQAGLLRQDSLFLGLGKGGKDAVAEERECRESVGFTDQRVYDEGQLKGILGAQEYTAGIRYGGTYGINPLLALQGLKNLLVQNGMQVFESTEMERLEDHTAYTHAGSVTADSIIIAVDKMDPAISPLAHEAFHAQTFLSVTEPLTDRELRILFPSGEQMQCWDSKLVYSYFRLTGDNRLLLGGGTPVTTYLRDAYNNPRVIRKIIKDFRSHFPELREPLFHAVLAWPDRHVAGPVAGHREAARAPARAFHPRLRRHPVGDILRQLCRADGARRGGRRLPEVLQLLLEQSPLFPADRTRQGHRQADPLLAGQCLGQVPPGRHPAQSRGWRKGVLSQAAPPGWRRGVTTPAGS